MSATTNGPAPDPRDRAFADVRPLLEAWQTADVEPDDALNIEAIVANLLHTARIDKRASAEERARLLPHYLYNIHCHLQIAIHILNEKRSHRGDAIRHAYQALGIIAHIRERKPLADLPQLFDETSVEYRERLASYIERGIE